MISIYITIGLIVAAVVITLIVSYILPKEKVHQVNQSLFTEEQQQKLKIKDLEKEYVQKQAELEKQYNETSNQFIKDLELQNKELEDAANEKLTEINKMRSDWDKEHNEKLLQWTQREADLQTEVRGLEERRDSIIQTLENEAKQSGEIFKTQQLRIAEEEIEKAKTELQAEYEKAKENAKNIYLETLSDMVGEITQEYGVKAKELKEVLIKLAEAQSKANAAIEVNKRAELDRIKKDFYRLQLSEEDVDEIKRLREVEPFLRDKEPLNKVIYKCYYEKPYTDLIGRVFGARKPSGIYKITNLNNGRCYVGQATNIPDRWKQHIKRGVGAEPVTQNKLYPAMKQEGVENFMFEVIEECKGADLTPREKYWTDFYQAQSYGYTVRKG